MKRISAYLVVALLSFAVGITIAYSWKVWRSPSPETSNSQPVVHIVRYANEDRRRGDWRPIFFESINKRAELSNLPNLQVAVLAGNDIEIRVWVGFGLTELEGFILERSGGQWSALHLDGIHRRLPRSKFQRKLPPPKSGWETAWQKLVDGGILTLPDAANLQCNANVLDGTGYVVEVNAYQSYRTYLYDNPAYAKCDEAKRMIDLGEVIADEFGVQNFNTKEFQ